MRDCGSLRSRFRDGRFLCSDVAHPAAARVRPAAVMPLRSRQHDGMGQDTYRPATVVALLHVLLFTYTHSSLLNIAEEPPCESSIHFHKLCRIFVLSATSPAHRLPAEPPPTTPASPPSTDDYTPSTHRHTPSRTHRTRRHHG